MVVVVLGGWGWEWWVVGGGEEPKMSSRVDMLVCSLLIVEV